MASNRATKLYRDSRQITISVDYAPPSLRHSMAPDLCMGWTFGQFYALDCKQLRLCHMTITHLTCSVESITRVYNTLASE